MNCDTVAPWYEILERIVYGQTLQRTRETFLKEGAGAERWLLIGEGDGRFLQALLARFTPAQITVLESSAAMIAIAHRRVGDRRDLEWTHISGLEAMEGLESYDGVVTHFFLDCLDEASMRKVVLSCARALRPGGLWMISEFRQPPHGWRRWRARFWLKLMYAFFGYTTGLKVRVIPDYATALAEAGLRRERQEFSQGGLVTAELWRKPAIGL
jgi:ubiquinone/menaquinone biosynthesis C-methylase UbiE